MQSFQYTRHEGEEQLIDFLVRRFPYQDRGSWINNIKNGALRVNNQKVTPLLVLRSKDVVSYERPREEEPEIDERYNILFQDEEILVVEKNGNIPISESGKYYRNTLLYLLKEKEGFQELYAVHRLDKETSGLLVIAKTVDTARIMGEQFAFQIPSKTYHAVLIGEMKPGEILVDRSIKKAKSHQSSVRIRQVTDEEGKPSQTLFTPVKSLNGLTLAKIKTLTGRTHQIRCHAEYKGYPILGDKLYGQSDEHFISILYKDAKPVFEPWGLIPRQLLHASSLTFPHPKSGEQLTFYSDFREEFKIFEFLKELL